MTPTRFTQSRSCCSVQPNSLHQYRTSYASFTFTRLRSAGPRLLLSSDIRRPFRSGWRAAHKSRSPTVTSGQPQEHEVERHVARKGATRCCANTVKFELSLPQRKVAVQLGTRSSATSSATGYAACEYAVIPSLHAVLGRRQMAKFAERPNCRPGLVWLRADSRPRTIWA